MLAVWNKYGKVREIERLMIMSQALWGRKHMFERVTKMYYIAKAGLAVPDLAGEDNDKCNCGFVILHCRFQTFIVLCPCVASQVSTFIACDDARMLGILLGSNSCFATPF